MTNKEDATEIDSIGWAMWEVPSFTYKHVFVLSVIAAVVLATHFS